MESSTVCQNPLVLSYLTLRKAVGWIGLAFPFILWLGGHVLRPSFGIQPSISAYYYTRMGNVFVGLLCAIGVFHLATEGYDQADRIAGRLACLFAFGVAWFPTTPASPPTPTHAQDIVGTVHYTFAALLFATLAFFCIRQFTQTTSVETMTRKKRERNAVYYTCGYVILGCIAVIGVVKQIMRHPILENFQTWLKSWNWNFWFESTALVAFGVAFLIKGEFLLKDEPGPDPLQSADPGS